MSGLSTRIIPSYLVVVHKIHSWNNMVSFVNGPGLRYEIAICIQTGEPVWINGPFPCGSWPDLIIARNALVDALDAGEYYLARCQVDTEMEIRNPGLQR
jgi:hypothetical protein